MMPIQIKDMIIHDEYITINRHRDVRYAMKSLIETPNCMGIVVDADEKPMGILNARHILMAIEDGKDLDNTVVEEVMSKNILLIRQDSLLIEALDRIKGTDTEAYCVVDPEDRLIGYFSLSDYRYSIKLLEGLGEGDKRRLRLMQAFKHMKDVYEED